MRWTLLACAVALGCSPAPHVDRPCLRCSEVELRVHEDLLCPDSFAERWEPLHQCRCARSSACAVQCPAWCGGGEIGVGCAECSAAMCGAEEAGCLGDLAVP